MMKWTKWTFLFAFLATTTLLAEDMEISAQGMGVSYRAAINDGLISALEQHYGIQFSGSERATISENESYASTNGEETNKAAVQDSVSKECQKWSKGRIAGYQVLSDSYDPSTKQYTVQLLVRLPGAYMVGSDPDARRRMAVGTFYTKADSVTIYGKSVPTLTWIELFSNELTIRLTQSRKFTMLERRFDTAIQDELKRLSDANAAPGDTVRLCQQLGTDYLLVGTVLFCDVSSPAVNPYTGVPVIPPSSAFVQVNYRVILAATGQLKWTDNVRIDAGDIEADSLNDFVVNSAECAAETLSDEILSALFPLEIVDMMSDGTVVIGEGGLSLRAGEVLNVYAVGRTVCDSRTGEVIDEVEERVGMVLVERVTEKLSYARVIEGDSSKMIPGSTRLDRTGSYVIESDCIDSVPVPTRVRGTPAGGVVVPF